MGVIMNGVVSWVVMVVVAARTLISLLTCGLPRISWGQPGPRSQDSELQAEALHAASLRL